MKARDLELCQIQHWYPRFRSISLRTLILPLPEHFVSYLLNDDHGLFLPASSDDALPARIPSSDSWAEEEESPQYDDEEEDDHDHDADQPSFPHLEALARSSIQSLGGSVFPKLNWSAPKDSAWISSTGSLKCHNFGEIVLLLKASDSLVHDLSHAFECCDDASRDRPETFVLALRKWYDIRPEMEFRGFVRGGLLVGISQREVTGFYPALVDAVESLEASLFEFFSQNLSERFELEDYTFDCYVTRDGRVKLVDFNPWGAFTLPLLFSWEELEEKHLQFAMALADIEDNVANKTSSKIRLRERGCKAEFRIVKSERHVQPNLRVGGGLPFDYVNTGPGSAWDEFLRKAGEELQQQTRETAAGG